MKRREFLDAVAVARSSHPCTPYEAAKFAYDVLDELDKIELSRPLDLRPGNEWGGDNIRAICAFIDALPEKTQDTFLAMLRERYGSR